MSVRSELDITAAEEETIVNELKKGFLKLYESDQYHEFLTRHVAVALDSDMPCNNDFIIHCDQKFNLEAIKDILKAARG